MNHLSELCRRLLKILAGDEELPQALEDAILARIEEAPAAEVEEGLHELWRLMRNVTREDCWENLKEEIQNNPRLREEIRKHFAPDPSRESQVAEVVEGLRGVGDWEPLKGMLEAFEGDLRAQEQIRRRITQMNEEIHGGRDPMTDYLPPRDACWEEQEFWFPQGPDEDPGRLSKGFGLLCRITPKVNEKIGAGPLFWGVLGPIQDALSHGDRQGYEDHINNGRLYVLRAQCREGRADFYDYWLWFQEEDGEAQRREATEAMIRQAERASTAEAEAFFASLDLSEASPAPERVLPDPDRLWRKLLEREISALSHRLLARAGLYYWHGSDHHHGQPVALAAFGIECEWNFVYEIPPFLPIWAAARGAAALGKWELARDCFNRALLGIALFASAGEESDRFHYDTGFIQELDLRFREEPSARSLRFFLYLALEMVADRGLDEMSALRHALEVLGRRLNVWRTGDEMLLGDELGEDVWNGITERTKVFLLSASQLWRFCEQTGQSQYGSVGGAYRSAIENEWREKVGPVITQLGGLNVDLLSLDRMLRWLEERTTTAVGRELLRPRLVNGSKLFEPEFLRQVDRLLLKGYLNPAAHSQGLTREQCMELRTILFEQGMLRDLLKSIQRHSPSS